MFLLGLVVRVWLICAGVLIGFGFVSIWNLMRVVGWYNIGVRWFGFGWWCFGLFRYGCDRDALVGGVTLGLADCVICSCVVFRW